MLRTLLALLIMAASLAAQSSQLRFTAVRRPVVEQRLEQVPASQNERGSKVQALFTEAGCAMTEQPVRKTKRPNLICTLPGETQETIVVGAHYDSVDAGQGAVDNWSGVSMLPSLFQGVAGSPRRHTYVFVGFSAEETGLNGSEAYVKALSKEQRKQVAAMVNLDCLGLSSTKVWVNGSDKKLVAILNGVARAMNLPLGGVNVDQVGSSDSQTFRDARIPAIDLHSVTQETLKVLHSPLDKLSAINRDEYYDSYKLVLGYLVYLDQALGAPETAGAGK